MYDVFISYSHIDKKYADAVCHHLEEANIKCWYASRNIPVGAVWAERINEAITHSKVFVLIISKHSVISNQVQKEINLARENQLELILFQISKVKVSDDIMDVKDNGHWLDAMDNALYTSLDQLHQKLCKCLLMDYEKVKKRNRNIALITRSIHNFRAGLRNTLSLFRIRVLDRIYDYLKESSILFLIIVFLVLALIIFLYILGQKIYIKLFYGIWALMSYGL